MIGTVTNCGCAMCQSQIPPSRPAWTNLAPPVAALPRLPSAAVVMKARMLALIQEELDRLPVTLMPEDWRWSLVGKALHRLRYAVEEISTTT